MGWHSRSMRAVDYAYRHNYDAHGRPLFRRKVVKYSTRDFFVLIALGPLTCGITWAMLLFNE